MPNFIYSIPSLPLFITLFLTGCLISAATLFAVTRFIPITLRKRENVPSGYIAGSISIIYAVLAGFTILYAMNNFDKASDISIHEATTITKIFRDASRLPEPLKTQVQEGMRNYTDIVIHTEFPALADGNFTKAGLPILNKLEQQLNSYNPTNMMNFFWLDAIHQGIDDLYTTYDQRMNINNSALTPDLWALFITSSLLTLMINCILGVSLRLHIVLQGILTLMVSSTFYLLIAMDHPFSGSFSVSTNVFETSMYEMNHYQKDETGKKLINRSEKPSKNT